MAKSKDKGKGMKAIIETINDRRLCKARKISLKYISTLKTEDEIAKLLDEAKALAIKIKTAKEQAVEYREKRGT